jgi:hypothetical protein
MNLWDCAWGCGKCNGTGPQFFRGLKTIAYLVINNSIPYSIFNTYADSRNHYISSYLVLCSSIYVVCSSVQLLHPNPVFISTRQPGNLESSTPLQTSKCKLQSIGEGHWERVYWQVSNYYSFFLEYAGEQRIISLRRRQTTIVPQIHQKLEMIGIWRPAPSK